MTFNNRNIKPAFWEWSLDTHKSLLTAFVNQHIRTIGNDNQITEASVQQLLASNLLRSVEALTVEEQPQEATSDDEPQPKRRRLDIPRILKDPYCVWFQKSTSDNGDTLWDESQDDIPETDGGKLSVLSVNGILNGMVGLKIANSVDSNPKTMFKEAIKSGLNGELTKIFGGSVTILQLHALAHALRQKIAEEVKADILRTTPQRIQNLLAPDLTKAEFTSIRKRVYDTVILGKGLNQDDPEEDLPTATNTGVHDIEKFKKCNTCGNNDQAEFVLDRRNGDVICEKCGTVVAESLMHEGSAYRKFEGEEDRNHHGDTANPLYSNAHNMGTSLSGVAPTTGAGIGGYGSGMGGGGRNLETILKNAHSYTELNVSQFGRTDRRTRTGYKDRQKKEAFVQMTHAGDSLNLHEAVVRRAKELFAGFRDDRELVQQFKGVLAACLCEAFEQLSSEGKLIMKQQQQQHDQQNQQTTLNGTTTLSSRAARRNELHHASLAGKGGLLLNSAKKEEKEDASNSKPAATWDLEDCRTWLLEASRRIAQCWIDEKKKNTPASKKLPSGPLGELEGQLVEHSIKLCEHLESELQSRASKTNGDSKRVITPRVDDMSKIGIKWQHGHERGSGGKGGVGGSGTATIAAKKRTAGQILILKTAKKLGDILNDKIAGEAIHLELRAVASKEEARKRKEMLEEASRQRLNQMKRKPWLQARVQQGEINS